VSGLRFLRFGRRFIVESQNRRSDPSSFYEPLPWRNPMNPGSPFGSRPPYEPFYPRTVPSLPEIPGPGPLIPTIPVETAPIRFPMMNPNNPMIGPDAAFRVRAALILARIMQGIASGPWAGPHGVPILVCKPCLLIDMYGHQEHVEL
jgi:hypothetical protein